MIRDQNLLEEKEKIWWDYLNRWGRMQKKKDKDSFRSLNRRKNYRLEHLRISMILIQMLDHTHLTSRLDKNKNE